MQRAPDRIQSKIRNLADGGPSGRKYKIQSQGRPGANGSYTVTLLKRACREQGLTASDPVEEHYFPDEGIIAIDLNPEGNHGGD